MAEENMKVSYSGDVVLSGARKSGEAKKAGDSLTAASAFMSSPIVASALRTQSGRDEFITGIKMQKESAFRRGDATMMSFFGHIMDAVQEMGSKQTIADNQTTGSKFDTNNYFAV